MLLTLGRLPKCLDIARALAARGCHVQIAEPHARHLTGASRAVQRSHPLPPPAIDRHAYQRALQTLARQERIDLIVPVSEETLFVADIADALPASVQVFGATPVTVRALHDKLEFARRCARLGLPVPETCAGNDPEARRLIGAGPTVSKPRYSCAGQGIHFLDQGTALPEPDRSPDRVVQRAIAGPLLASFSIAHQGRVLLTVLYRARVLSGSVAVCFERLTPQSLAADAWATGWSGANNLTALCRSAEESIEQLVADSRYSGFIAFDFIADPDQRAVAIECNPRATSGIHFLQPQTLASCILDPQTAQPDALREPTRLQQFYPCLTETQNALWARPGQRQRGLARSHLGNLLRSRDVTFAWRDPLPFLLMPYWAWPIMAPALFEGRSFGETATQDIDWVPARDPAPETLDTEQGSQP